MTNDLYLRPPDELLKAMDRFLTIKEGRLTEKRPLQYKCVTLIAHSLPVGEAIRR